MFKIDEILVKTTPKFLAIAFLIGITFRVFFLLQKGLSNESFIVTALRVHKKCKLPAALLVVEGNQLL